MSDTFKEKREKVEGKKDELFSEGQIKALNNHVLLKEGLTDYSVAQLVILNNGLDVDRKYIDEFKLFGYVNEDAHITEKGQKFIESDEVIVRLKEMLK